MKVAIAILLIAVVAIAVVHSVPAPDCYGKHEVRACDCPKPCGSTCPRPSKCVCVAGYHRNHLGECVPNCPSCCHGPNPYPSK